MKRATLVRGHVFFAATVALMWIALPRTADASMPSNVAIFQESNPHGFTSNQQILDGQGIPWTIYGMSAIGTVDITPYSKIIVSSHQTKTFMLTISSNRNWFESWLNGAPGRTLEIHCDTQDWHNWAGSEMPGGSASRRRTG